MRVLKNILIAIGIMIAAIILGAILDQVNPPRAGGEGAGRAIAGFTWLGTSIWASISSNRLEFRKYKTSMALHPAMVFVVHFFLWIIAFPWFLTVRGSIKDGTAEVKDEFKGETNAVPQPVRHAVPPPIPPKARVGSSPVPPPLPSAIPAPPPLPTPREPQNSHAALPSNRLDQLQMLAQLKDQGILTEAEFQGEKQKILGQA